MPVACATAAWGAVPPASTATNTATSRRIFISLPPSGERESGTQPHGHRSPPARQRGPSTARTGRDGQSNQKRTPPVRMNVLPPPISPRASANGVRCEPLSLNVVPPSRFSPALVWETLVPPDGPADACAMFKPAPAYGRKLLRAGTVNRYATLPLISQ